MTYKIIEERVGSQWLLTSPDLPGLFVADSDIDEARKAVPDAVAMLERMAERRQAKEYFNMMARTA